MLMVICWKAARTSLSDMLETEDVEADELLDSALEELCDSVLEDAVELELLELLDELDCPPPHALKASTEMAIAHASAITIILCFIADLSACDC